MSRKKKSTTPKDKPFNNPFADNIRKLRKRLRDRSARTNDASRSPRARPDDAFESLTDDEAFRRAVDGSRPVEARGREVAHTPNTNESIKLRADEYDLDDVLSDAYFDMRFSDQYMSGSCASVSKETLDKLAEGVFAVRSHVDLHGMALDDAKQTVDEFLTDCQRRGECCVLVITGKGRNSPGQVGVLRAGIPEWLARGPSARRVLAFVTARQCDGGEGALYVLLRKSAGRKTRIDVESGGGT
jgi:DNA-nicking Smr family endonuclease